MHIEGAAVRPTDIVLASFKNLPSSTFTAESESVFDTISIEKFRSTLL